MTDPQGKLQDSRVFVCSTSKDLERFRAAAREVILDVQWHPEMMEHFGARAGRTVDTCLQIVRKCDLVVLLVAFHRGWVPTIEEGGDGVRSVSELEYREAQKHDIPVLILLANENWPGNLWELDAPNAIQAVRQFRDGLNQPAVFFDWENPESDLPAFRARLRQTLLDHRERLAAEQRHTYVVSSKIDFFDGTCEAIMDGAVVPFFGTELQPDGMLTSNSLAVQLADGAIDESQLSLASAAAHRERLLGDRYAFLTKFARILEAGEARAAYSTVYEIVAGLDRLKLLISGTHDRILEQHLVRSGRSHVVLSHILSSFDGAYDGRILVHRTGEEPAICLADGVEVRDDECVVYKPMGSPYLNDLTDPSLEIDTVVITESDYLTFLGRLDNQHTQIPTALTRHLQRRPLLFIGYSLDVWQYRLVMQVFQSGGARGRRSRLLAVRRPDSSMEELAWNRLGADLIPLEPDEFAERFGKEFTQLEGQVT